MESPEDQSPSLSRPRPFARWTLLLILLLGLGIRVHGLLLPWNGKDFHSAFGTYATGVPARNFKLHGLAESKGMPWFWRLPNADGSVHHAWYTHHPATDFYLTAGCLKLFGDSRLSQSLPALLGSLLAIVAAFALARELWSTETGLLAAAVMAATPMGSFYGVHPWTESILQACHLYAILYWVRWRRTGRKGPLLLSALLLFLGTLFDWPSLFILPGLGLYTLGCWIRTKKLLPLLPALLLPVLGLVPVVGHKLHMSYALSEAELREETANTLEWATSLPEGKTTWDHAELQWKFLLKYFGAPLLVLVALALLVQLATLLRTKRATTCGALLALGLAGPIYVFLFRGRSWNHDFFWSLSLPYAALCVAGLGAGLQQLLHQRPKLARLALAIPALILCALLVRDSLKLWHHDTTPRVDQVWAEPWVKELIEDESNVIVATYGYGMSFAYRGRATVIPDVNSLAALKELKRKHLRHLAPERKVFFLFDGQVLPYYPAFLEELKRIDPGTLHVLDPKQTKELTGFQLIDLSRWVRS